MAPSILPCSYCRTLVPQLNVSEAGFRAILAAFRSKTLAEAELRHDTGCTEKDAKDWVAHITECQFSWPLTAEDQAILARIESVFEGIPKPEHFTRYQHCSECAEHDATLRSKTRKTLTRTDLGTLGWSPIDFCNMEGIAYFFPALAHHALLPALSEYGLYCDEFVYYLASGPISTEFLLWCQPAQRQAIYGLIQHLATTRNELLNPEHIQLALSIWKFTSP